MYILTKHLYFSILYDFVCSAKKFNSFASGWKRFTFDLKCINNHSYIDFRTV